MDPSAYERMASIEEDLWWYRGRRACCFQELEARLAGRRDLKILDVGCGTGYNLLRLAQYGEAYGLDMAPEALEYCRRRGVERVTLQTAESLPHPDSCFDLVTAFDVIEHIRDDLTALTEMRRVLKAEGRLLIYTPALPWLFSDHDAIVGHHRRYLREELCSKLRGSGFEIERCTYTNLIVLPLVVAARAYFLLGRRLGAPAVHHEMKLPHPAVNRCLTEAVLFEAKLLRRCDLPYGMSLLAVARRR